MTPGTLCQAATMDYLLFRGDGEVPPCFEYAVTEVDGYRLCLGCAEALETMAMIAKRLRAERTR